MTQNILLIGDGILADYVHDQLYKQYSIIRQHTIADELLKISTSLSYYTTALLLLFTMTLS